MSGDELTVGKLGSTEWRTWPPSSWESSSSPLDGSELVTSVEQLRDAYRALEAAQRDRDEALALLRAIWHNEGPDKWPDPKAFRERVEALVGEPPPSEWRNTWTGDSGGPYQGLERARLKATKP